VARTISYDQHIRRIIIISALTSLFLLIAHAVYLQYNIVDESIKKEARKTSMLSFEAIYAAMSRGWDRRDIDAIIHRLNKVESEMEISLFRAEAVQTQFGSRPQSTDAMITRAIMEKSEQIRITGAGRMRYVRPVTFEADCLRCHSGAAVGDVAGVVSVAFPVAAFRLSGDMVFNMLVLLFVMMLGIVFLLLYLYLRHHLVNPLKRFAERIAVLTRQGDLTQTIELKSSALEIKEIEEGFNALTASLHTTQERLKTLSVTDDLTGLSNRRHFEAVIAKEIERDRRYQSGFSLIMVDLDNFKPINDDYGHIAGDKMLKAVAALLQENIRKTDLAARLGGDEFVLLLPESGKEQAKTAAQKIGKLLGGTVFDIEGHRLGITASFGVSTWPEDGETPDELLARADMQMYRVKR
jgi:diguanylate cyclase (GGDEF)-like protein